MALEDILGVTSEIKIIDFLADNMDCSYNQTEISECTGLSRTTVNQKIPVLIQKNVVVIDREVGKFKTFRLADNDIVKYLIAAALVHSFKDAENPLSDEEQLELIKKHLGEHQTFEEQTDKSPGSNYTNAYRWFNHSDQRYRRKNARNIRQKLDRKGSPG